MGFLCISKKFFRNFPYYVCLSPRENFSIFFSEMNEFYLITFHWPKYIIKRELIKTNFLEQLSKCSHLSFTIERGQWWGEGKGVKMSLDTRVESLSRVVLDQPRTISKAIISMQDGNSLIM